MIVRDGIARMYGADPEDLIYCLALYNEAFPQPTMPDGVDAGPTPAVGDVHLHEH